MDFDIGQVAVPFRMQPGLRRLEPGARHLTRLAPDGALGSERQSALQSGTTRLAVPGFDPAPALAAIAAQARQEGLPIPADTLPLELAFEEDFAVLDGATGLLPWLAVCVPSHWAPEDKLGLPFAAVHAPVADNAVLLAAADSLVQLVTGGEHWERFVWTLTPSGRYDQHPRRHAREPWPGASDSDDFAARCFLRAERQTFIPVGRGTRQAVFTIRVMLQPLVEAIDTQAKAHRLHEALASMSEAALAYKNLAPAQAPLLRWLAARSG